MIDWQALEALAEKTMAARKAHLTRERGFIWRHCRRTAVGVIQLRERVTGDASHDDALRIAAMFHDIGKDIEPHEHTGALLCRDLLADLLPPALLEEVVCLIAAHKDHQSTDPWARLLQDADIIDHFGTVELGISFQYGAFAAGEPGMDATLAWYRDEYMPYVERTRKQLYCDAARAIFEEKVAFTQAFAQRFAVEMMGGYV